MAFLEVEHVTKHFPVADGGGTFCVFKDVHFHVERGEFVTTVGHSGCGKSTLLFIMAGLEAATEGGIILDGHEVVGPGRDRMVVFQNFALMPWMTVFENVHLAVRQAFPDWNRAKKEEWTRRWIETVGLAEAERKRPVQLSGGMRQRAGLARAFAMQPKVLLLDEPFAQIDALTRGVIQEELIRMWAETRITVFMVTHDVDEAILLSDRILLMTPGPDAELAGAVAVDIPRPRTREAIIEHPRYYPIRNHILHFLTGQSRRTDPSPDHQATSALRAAAGAPNGNGTGAPAAPHSKAYTISQGTVHSEEGRG